MGEVAAIQTAIAWVSQYATATAEQVGTLVRPVRTTRGPKLGGVLPGKLMDVVNYEPGTVSTWTTTASSWPDRWERAQPDLSRWNRPSCAAAAHAGVSPNTSPATPATTTWPHHSRRLTIRRSRRRQPTGVGRLRAGGREEGAGFVRESGRLSQELVASVDVKITPPSVALANRRRGTPAQNAEQGRRAIGDHMATASGTGPKHEAARSLRRRRSGREERRKLVSPKRIATARRN